MSKVIIKHDDITIFRGETPASQPFWAFWTRVTVDTVAEADAIEAHLRQLRKDHDIHYERTGLSFDLPPAYVVSPDDRLI